MGAVPVFASAGEALEVARASLRFLAGTDTTGLAADEQAGLLRGLEKAASALVAARASVLTAFTAAKGYAADADYSVSAWLIHHTGVTKGAARAHAAWVRRAARHPELLAGMAAEGMPESAACTMATWTDKLPDERRHEADALLATEAAAGMGLRDLAVLAAQILARCRPDQPDRDPDRDFEDRSVTVQATFQGAGIIHGDLTPECAAAVQAVLDSLAAPRGSADSRTKEQRYHDALAEAMRRLLASDLVPQRAGQPVKALVHISLADMMRLNGSSALLGDWITRVREAWAARRAAASESGSDGGAWLDGDAATAAACDAPVTPVVTGDLDLDALDDLIRLCVHLDKLRRDDEAARDRDQAAQDRDGAPGGPMPTLREVLEQQVIAAAVALLAGPGGLASHLRRRQLGARLAGPSLPLDIGLSMDIPVGIRRAVTERDQHCRWPGGCDQPASGCEVHHLTHKADGGKTSVWDCALFCTFHHQVVIHRWGWTVVLNPDGSTTAWNKDRTKVLHSHTRNHSPPARPG